VRVVSQKSDSGDREDEGFVVLQHVCDCSTYIMVIHKSQFFSNTTVSPSNVLKVWIFAKACVLSPLMPCLFLGVVFSCR
jgi:hypothetical protein